MPAHSSHLLQPLDVGCFSPLKRAYGKEISGLARDNINHITKTEFLAAFEVTHRKTFTKENILSSFRGAGLLPFDPQVVISKLDVRLRTPTPPIQEDTPWESKTPHTAKEFNAQLALIRNSLDSSPSTIQSRLDQLEKGHEKWVAKGVLMQEEISRLRKANEAATKRRGRKRKYIQTEGTLSIDEGMQLVAHTRVDGGEQSEIGDGGGSSESRPKKQRRCGNCGKPGHNARTCQEDEETPTESVLSEVE